MPFRFSLTFYLIVPSVFSNVYLLTTVDIYKTSTISMWLYVIFTIPDIFFASTTFNVIHSYCYILVILSAKVVVESKTFYNNGNQFLFHKWNLDGIVTPTNCTYSWSTVADTDILSLSHDDDRNTFEVYCWDVATCEWWVHIEIISFVVMCPF